MNKNVRELNNISLLKKETPVSMTNEEWQTYFSKLRNKIKPSSKRQMKTTYSIWVNGYKDFSYFAYCGDTEWKYYCKFINSILNAIRKGESDYCFYIYQIADLLKFEHDRLKAIWLPEYQCFKVSLN